MTQDDRYIPTESAHWGMFPAATFDTARQAIETTVHASPFANQNHRMIYGDYLDADHEIPNLFRM